MAIKIIQIPGKYPASICWRMLADANVSMPRKQEKRPTETELNAGSVLAR